LSVLKETIKAGADIVQIRDKQGKRELLAKEIEAAHKYIGSTDTKLIINDYPDLARDCRVDGVHLGQADISLSRARSILGKQKLIGISCHSLKEARAAQEGGADYASLGPIFASPIKPEYPPVGLGLIRQAAQKLRIPFVAVGGINLSNIRLVLEAGARRVAICRAICLAQDITQTIIRFKQILNRER
jgi:thiamine-phosphate pyrophosphorylase